jgi:plastocyanin
VSGVRRLKLRAAVVGAACLVATASPVAAGAQAGQEGTIVDFDFEPAQFTVDVGARITWRNTGERPHTVTDRGGTFDTDPILPGATASVTFSTPGTYQVFCRINPSRMNGTVTVRPGAGPQRAIRVEGIDPALPGEEFRFSPAELTVEAGGTIVFANVGGRPHTFTAEDGSFTTGVVPPGPEMGRFAGTNATITVDRPGTYAFRCEIHPQTMRGTVTVTGQARDGPGPAPPSAAPSAAALEMVDFAFEPAQVSVAPGGAVTFRNRGDAPHTATLDDAPVDTGTIQPGAEGRFSAPTQPGSYSYRCTIHPGRMRGVLVVVGQNTADPTRTGDPGAAPAAIAVGGGPGGGISFLALLTGVAAAFFGGFGISAFAGRRRRPATAGGGEATSG